MEREICKSGILRYRKKKDRVKTGRIKPKSKCTLRPRATDRVKVHGKNITAVMSLDKIKFGLKTRPIVPNLTKVNRI